MANDFTPGPCLQSFFRYTLKLETVVPHVIYDIEMAAI